MLKKCLQLGLVLVPALWTSAVYAQAGKDASGRPVLVTKDASGRIQSRTVLNADGSRHVTSNEYWPESTVARHTVDQDIDASGRTTRRLVQEFDDHGRVLEKRDLNVDAAGKERGTRTRYSYDPQGQRRETSSPLNP
jgi:hypothetical protein